MEFLRPLQPHVHWGLRASLAATFIYHGLTKFPPDGFAQSLGMPIAVAWLVAFGEVAAGVLLLIGPFAKDLFTRLGGLIVIIIMLGAIFMVHLPKGWNVVTGGMEFQVLMLATGLFFLVKGNES